jgi:HEPN domain-containing protein
MADENFTPGSYAKEWLSFAKMDLSSAEFLLAMWPIPLAIICYHCQQSAEKCLKGLLALKNQIPPKMHDLSLLIDLCKPFFPEIMSVSVQCTALNPYSSQPRYPREMLITEQSMKDAIENAKVVYAFAEPLIADQAPDIKDT